MSHVTDVRGLTTFLEINQPFDERGPIIKSVGGICYFDQIKVTEDMSLVDFEEDLKKDERLDIAFAEVKDDVTFLQLEMDFKVEACTELPLFMEDATVATCELIPIFLIF